MSFYGYAPQRQYNDLNLMEEKFIDDLLKALERINPAYIKCYIERNVSS